jgi:60 kDa SS-A/Ro ribonucleoprotein
MIMDADSKKRVADILVIITDGQQNGGRPFYEAVAEYRKRFNPKLRLFVVDIGSYSNSGGLVHDSDLNYVIVGLAPRTLEFISLAAEGFSSMVSAIEKGAV